MARPYGLATASPQYETFDFRIARTERSDIYFEPDTREATELTARLAER